MVLPDGGNPEEDEDEGVAHAAPHLHEVLDRGVGLEGDVGLHVTLHAHGAGNDAEHVRNQQWGKKKKQSVFLLEHRKSAHQ